MKTAIVISSCDLFIDCWLPMIHSFHKYWTDCPYPIYFISNFKSLDDEGVIFIKVGKHKGFGANMKKALELIKADTIILFLEDYFLKETVVTKIIKNHVNHCEKYNIDFLKIDSCDVIYRDSLRRGSSFYCTNPINVKYSLNTAIAVWKRESLQSLCVEGFSAWNFERKGINHIKKNNLKINSETILSTSYEKQTIKKISGPGAVSKGRWTNEGVDYLRANGFSSLITMREVEGKFTRYLISFYTPNSLFWIPLGLLLRLIQKLKINV